MQKINPDYQIYNNNNRRYIFQNQSQKSFNIFILHNKIINKMLYHKQNSIVLICCFIFIKIIKLNNKHNNDIKSSTYLNLKHL